MPEARLPSSPSDEAWALSHVLSTLGDPARRSVPLPSRSALEQIVANLRAALFPAHWGPHGLTDVGLDYFVGDTLRTALRSLEVQIACELRAATPPRSQSSDAITQAFAACLPGVRKGLDEDVREACDASASGVDEALFCSPGVAAIIHHRLAHELHVLGAPLVARVIAEISHTATGIDIHPAAQVGPGFVVVHGTGVVIGATAIIGRRVRIHQGVTLGSKSFVPEDEASAHPSRGPVLEDDVVVHAGATVMGAITVGRGSTIGGSVWLTRSVPPRTRALQARLRTEVFDEAAGEWRVQEAP